jgi:hypothetical protein
MKKINKKIIDNPNSFARRQNDDIFVVKLNVHVCL